MWMPRPPGGKRSAHGAVSSSRQYDTLSRRSSPTISPRRSTLLRARIEDPRWSINPAPPWTISKGNEPKSHGCASAWPLQIGAYPARPRPAGGPERIWRGCGRRRAATIRHGYPCTPETSGEIFMSSASPRIVVIGSTGMLGAPVTQELRRRQASAVTCPRPRTRRRPARASRLPAGVDARRRRRQ